MLNGKAPWVMLGALALAALGAALATTAAFATAPGENGRLVFTADVGKHTQLFTIVPDGSGLTQVTHFTDGGDALNASWSPDGTRIAFERDFPYPHAAVYTMNADGSNLRPLTADKRNYYEGGPSYSHDGKQIVFTREIHYSPSALTARDYAQVVVMTVNGKSRRSVTPKLYIGTDDSNHYGEFSSFSPDGKRIVYVKQRGAKAALFVTTLNGKSVKQLTSYSLGIEDRVDWSPDGSLILISNRHDDAHRISSNVYTVRPDGTGLTKLTHAEGGRINEKAGSWSPDGEQIAFVHDTGRESSLYVMNADGSGIRQVTHGLIVHGGGWGASR